MTGADRHKRIKAIFLQACELAGDQRTAFLDRECGEDDEMRAEIEEMVRFEEENPDYLETSHTSSPVAQGREQPPPRPAEDRHR